MFTEDDFEMPGVDIPAADETAATASSTSADATLAHNPPEDVGLTPSDVQRPRGTP